MEDIQNISSINHIEDGRLSPFVSNALLQAANSIATEANSCIVIAKNALAAIESVNVSHVKESMISNAFFTNSAVLKERSINGAIKTPEAVANFIISLAYNRWHKINVNSKRKPSELHWFDPCCGAGVFPCAIVNYYYTKLSVRSVFDFPFITLSELSPLGLAATLFSLKLALNNMGMEIADYINSNRLTLLQGDSLSCFPERPNIFTTDLLFDIVIGNPPYVRSTLILPSYKKKLHSLFPEAFHGGADLYTYFIASGLSNLYSNGVLSFISPASFTRAKSGQAIREWLWNKAQVDSYIDLDETRVFDDADIHAAIYVLIKKPQQSRTVNYIHISNKNALGQLCSGKLKLQSAVFEKPVGYGWAFHSSELSLKSFSDIFIGCKSISELGFNVYSGIRPGYAEAFIVDENTLNHFSPRIRIKWFKPTILPADIKRWYGAKVIHYMLVIPSGTQQIDRELIEYLKPFKEKLLKRSEVKNPREWFTLRSCSYYSKMNTLKIAYPDLSAQQRFSLFDKGVLVPDGAYFIDSNNLVLLGILNSSIAKDFFIKRCSSVGSLSSKGRFRFKKCFVQDLPVPTSILHDGPAQQSIKVLVESFIKGKGLDTDMPKLDKFVSQLYKEAK